MLNYSQALNTSEGQFGIAAVRHGILIIHLELWIHYLPRLHRCVKFC